MNLLFRLNKDMEDPKEFFEHILPNRDDSCFYNVNKLRKVGLGDTIYFAHSGYIVAEATFAGEIIERAEKYNYGHKLENIKIIESIGKVDTKILSSRTTYLDSKTKIDSINKTLSLNIDIFPNEVDPLYEGSKTKVYVNSYERNPKAREACLAYYGYDCQICNFNFEYTYGKIGKDSIHVHHIVPISKIGINYQVNPIEDLIPVCPNCHLILHRNNAPTVEELRKKLE